MIKYILLGIVQGLTEFLPISSSGHLVILQNVLGINSNQLAISVVLHLGTLFAVIIFFHRDILAFLKNLRLIYLSAITIFITGIIGIAGKDFFENLFASLKAVAIAWIFTGFILVLTKRFSQGQKDKLTAKDALILGFTQGLAIIPGVSRSGITISTLFFRKIKQQLAFTFSFIISIPVILGAALLEARKIQSIPQADIKNLITGFIFSFITGIFALSLLKLIINRAKFYYFGYYCLGAGLITLLFLK